MVDYMTGAPPFTPTTTITTQLPQSLADLELNVKMLVQKASANAGDADLAQRLEAFKAEAADLFASWPDPSRRWTPSTAIHISDDPTAWRQDDPSFYRLTTVDGHLGLGSHKLTIDGATVDVTINSIRTPKHGVRIDAFATLNARKAA